jgi:hypothetical protein
MTTAERCGSGDVRLLVNAIFIRWLASLRASHRWLRSNQYCILGI